MKRKPVVPIAVAFVALLGTALAARAADTVLEGKDAFGDYQRDAPGVLHKITVGDLPQPFASQSSRNFPQLAPRNGAMPKVPAGFSVSIFAEGFKTPREMKIAPNGDIFLAESGAGRVHVLRSNGPGKPPTDTVFAEVAERPFGISFFPAGPNPKFVYIASMNEVVRFPYEVGDTKARGPKEMIVPNLPGPVQCRIQVNRDGPHKIFNRRQFGPSLRRASHVVDDQAGIVLRHHPRQLEVEQNTTRIVDNLRPVFQRFFCHARFVGID